MTIRINRVYTRSGDKGKTGLVGGTRVSKADPRIEAIGAIDELNASLGVAKEGLTPQCMELRELLEFLQQELFDLGSEVAAPPGADYPGMWKVRPEHISRLEGLCDRFGEELEELRSFILPGGSAPAAALHLARTIARRAERRLVELYEQDPEGLSLDAIKYLNRVSDLLFNMARWSLKRDGRLAPLWQQENSRSLPERFR